MIQTVLLFLLLTTIPVMAQWQSEIDKKTAQSKVKEATERYNGYYKLEDQKKQRIIQRRKGANLAKKDRLNREQLFKKARKDFVTKRDKQRKKDLTKDYKEYLRNERAREAQRQIAAKRYAQDKTKLNQLIKQRGKKIPEAQEFGL